MLDSQSVPGALPCPRAPHCRRNNVVSGNKAFGIHVAGNTGHDNPQYDGASHIVIENNTISGQGYSGSIVWQEAARDNVIKNNIISDNMQSHSGEQGVYFYHSGSGNVVTENLFHSSKGDGDIADTASSHTASGNINVDPHLDSSFTAGSAAAAGKGADASATHCAKTAATMSGSAASR